MKTKMRGRNEGGYGLIIPSISFVPWRNRATRRHGRRRRRRARARTLIICIRTKPSRKVVWWPPPLFVLFDYTDDCAPVSVSMRLIMTCRFTYSNPSSSNAVVCQRSNFLPLLIFLLLHTHTHKTSPFGIYIYYVSIARRYF